MRSLAVLIAIPSLAAFGFVAYLAFGMWAAQHGLLAHHDIRMGVSGIEQLCSAGYVSTTSPPGLAGCEVKQ